MIEQASLVLGNGNWAVKSDSLLGYRTIDGKYYPRDMTFTRATTGTRVNEAGLVEVVPYNLLQRSEEFDNAIWTKTTASVVANATTSPIGTLTADNLIPNAVTFGLVQQTANITANVPNTFSIYVKYNGISTFQLQTRDNANNANVALVFFNVLTGVISVAPSASGAYSNASADIESVGNGWYRLSLTSTSNISVTSKFRLVGDLSDGVNGYFIWGAQLVEGTEPLDYLPTTDRLDIARIDYSTGEPALLLEPQRTNLALRSQEFDNALWSKTGITVTPNQGIAPDGTLTMDLITFDSADRATTQGISVTSGATYTFSVWLATQSGTQTVEIGNINVSTFQSVTVTTTPQRFEVTQVASASTRYPGIKSTAAYSILAWGAQLELGNYSTSYIPTTTASVTRNADQVFKTGISSLIGQTEGTIYWEGTSDGGGASVNLACFNFSSSSVALTRQGSNIVRAIIQHSSGAFNLSSSAVSGKFKAAIAYKNGDSALYVNGVLAQSSSSAISFTSSFTELNLGVGPQYFAAANQSKCNAAALWKTRLTNDELATLTSL